MKYRIGYGYDVHQLVDGRRFVLGGIEIPYHLGALGHSDADVLIHAICDALLGAANLGDIGLHFPDNDAQYKNIDSKILLQKVKALIADAGYSIENIDSTICLQAPKIAEYIPRMKEVLAPLMKIAIEDISIKATTTEKLGFVGRKEGIAAHAVVLIKK